MQVCALLAIPALLAWVTGRPFVFPSLGLSVFKPMKTFPLADQRDMGSSD
jgi:hypothetical protein